MQIFVRAFLTWIYKPVDGVILFQVTVKKVDDYVLINFLSELTNSSLLCGVGVLSSRDEILFEWGALEYNLFPKEKLSELFAPAGESEEEHGVKQLSCCRAVFQPVCCTSDRIYALTKWRRMGIIILRLPRGFLLAVFKYFAYNYKFQDGIIFCLEVLNGFKK